MRKALFALLALLPLLHAHPGSLLGLPQEARHYLPKHALPIPQRAKLKKSYLEQWYAPWVDMQAMDDLNKVFWMQDTLHRVGYDKNLQPYTSDRLQAILEDMDMPHYPSVELRAVVIADANVRAVPSDAPYYLKDGQPFDRWQNSMIFAGTPVLITHYNKAKTYAHIQSSFVFGWVRLDKLAAISSKQMQTFLHFRHYLTPTKDKVPLTNGSVAHMGEIFIKVPHHFKQVYTYAKDTKGFVKLIPTPLHSPHFTPFPRPFTQRAMAVVIDTMLGQPYGWGGAEQKRDCSAFTRDSFASFGILLPRNSLAQVRYANNMVDLSHLAPRKKEAYIIKHATPFATILWLKGHIMLYLGAKHHRAIVAHNVWSVLVSKDNAYDIRKTAITTLDIGHKHAKNPPSFSLLARILGMSDLYRYALKLPNNF
ncbi:Putative lipoprotein [Helicobacter sp. NHP21005]|uniref:C40 family peptidase n=1 Tax=Helicobacter felistomachi TaxID=3040201 RepID=UPI0025747142|nr:SH3 domain-containing C40 family peptidase [Helicobacter sp. NHP21005]BEG57419.1 Putative lipoprotein [Helicobacter sp. NHP21005]